MPYAKRAGAQLHYVCSGKPSKRCLLFIHGANGACTSWFQNVKHFVDEGWYVVCMSIRGWGMSRLESIDGWDPRFFGDDVMAVLDDVGCDDAALICQSLGGWLGVRAAFEHPSRVCALVMCNTAMGLTDCAAAYTADGVHAERRERVRTKDDRRRLVAEARGELSHSASWVSSEAPSGKTMTASRYSEESIEQSGVWARDTASTIASEVSGITTPRSTAVFDTHDPWDVSFGYGSVCPLDVVLYQKSTTERVYEPALREALRLTSIIKGEIPKWSVLPNRMPPPASAPASAGVSIAGSPQRGSEPDVLHSPRLNSRNSSIADGRPSYPPEERPPAIVSPGYEIYHRAQHFLMEATADANEQKAEWRLSVKGSLTRNFTATTGKVTPANFRSAYAGPLHFITSERDGVIPWEVVEYAAALCNEASPRPLAQRPVKCFRGNVGHSPYYEVPDEFNDEVKLFFYQAGVSPKGNAMW